MLRDHWFFGRKTGVFTLQWHLTNACPLHCHHCYDRSQRDELSLDQALEVVADLLRFCRHFRVSPRLSLTGGDPLLYRHFWDLYRAIAEAKIPTAILGNPIPHAVAERLVDFYPPICYQVSLEGLRSHNDHVRGAGHFDRTLTFLDEARRIGLETHVMLTLTQENLQEVIPLGQQLRGLTSRFTFNRLASVGEARNLPGPAPSEFRGFLEEYLLARRSNPVFGFKENLFNVLRHRAGRTLFPGCTGYGCGAAFNFLALLPDGEVHACRKFPSFLGRIQELDLRRIYSSPAAQAYRQGPIACRSCPIRQRCGGCMAVSYGHGLDPLRARDPDCFMPGIGLD